MGEIGNVAKSGTVLSAGGTAARRRAPDQICRRPALFGNRAPPYLPGLERGDKSDRVRFCPEIYRNGRFDTKRVRLAFVAWPLAGPSGSSATRLPFELRSSAHLPSRIYQCALPARSEIARVTWWDGWNSWDGWDACTSPMDVAVTCRQVFSMDTPGMRPIPKCRRASMWRNSRANRVVTGAEASTF